MRSHTCVVLMISCHLLAQNAVGGSNDSKLTDQTNTTNPLNSSEGNKSQNDQPVKSKLKRPKMDLSEFELAPKTDTHAMQIGGGTRGLGGTTTLYAPNKGKAFDLRPVFNWTQTTKASKFVFRLLNASGQAVYEKELMGRSFRYPEDAPPLQSGNAYCWTVEPAVSVLGPPSEPACLVIVDNPERAQIAKSLADAGNDALERAGIFIDHRLWYDAIEAYSELISRQATPELYEQRAEIYKQAYNTADLAKEDVIKATELRAVK